MKKVFRSLLAVLAIVLVFGFASTAMAGAIGSWEYLKSEPYSGIFRIGTATIESFHGYTDHHYFGSLRKWFATAHNGWSMWAVTHKGGGGQTTVTIRNWYSKNGIVRGENRQFTMSSSGSVSARNVGGQFNW